MLLGLDLGTTNVKALVTDLAGRALGNGSCAIRLEPVGPAGVEQDLEDIWVATGTAIRQAIHGLDAHAIRAIGVSSQGGALQVLDGNGRPHGRVLSWLDQRGQPDDEALTRERGRQWFLDRLGHGRSGLAIGQLLRLRRESPGLLDPPTRIGFVGDCIVGRLCGHPAHDATSCGLTLLLNPRRQTYDPDVLARLGLGLEQLPDLVPARIPAGTLLPEAAALLGLPADIPVSVAIHDQYAAALGVGAVTPGAVMVGAGTAWVLLAVTDRLPAPAIDDAYVCSHPVDGLFGQIVSLVNGGSALTWALGLTGRAAATPADIEALLTAAPPGCDGLVCWPFLAPFGASGLPPGIRGRWSGLHLSHTPAHLIRAVVEGLAFELNRHLDFLRRAETTVSRLVLGGTVARSQATTQILADVTGLPIDGVAGGEGSLRGAVILARALVEPAAPLAALALELTPPRQRVEPGPYREMYLRSYRGYLSTLPPAEDPALTELLLP